MVDEALELAIIDGTACAASVGPGSAAFGATFRGDFRVTRLVLD